MSETISGEEIDRVFDSGYEQGTLNERGRIIALLETELGETSQGEVWIPLVRAIALIEGDDAVRRQTQMSEYGDKVGNE